MVNDIPILSDPHMKPVHYRLVMNSARGIATLKNKKKPNWVLAMDLFCVGSTKASDICRYADIDGDALTVGTVWRSKYDE